MTTTPTVPSVRLRITPAIAIAFAVLIAGASLIQIGTIWFAPAASFPVSVSAFQPAFPENFEVAPVIHPEAVQSGGLTSGTVVIEGADPETRIWTTLATLSWSVLLVWVCVAIARLARAARERGFTHALARTFGTLSVVVLALGVLWQWFAQTAAYRAAEFVYGTLNLSGEWEIGGEPPVTQTVSWPNAGFTLTIDFWPVWAALALGALAALLRHAARLQRETDGLV